MRGACPSSGGNGGSAPVSSWRLPSPRAAWRPLPEIVGAPPGLVPMLLSPNLQRLVPRPPPSCGGVPAPPPELPPARRRRDRRGGGPRRVRRSQPRCWKSKIMFGDGRFHRRRQRCLRLVGRSGGRRAGLDQTCSVTACPRCRRRCACHSRSCASSSCWSLSAPEGALPPPADIPRAARTPPVLCGARTPTRATPRGWRTPPAYSGARSSPRAPPHGGRISPALRRRPPVPSGHSRGPVARIPLALQRRRGNGPLYSGNRPLRPVPNCGHRASSHTPSR